MNELITTKPDTLSDLVSEAVTQALDSRASSTSSENKVFTNREAMEYLSAPGYPQPSK